MLSGSSPDRRQRCGSSGMARGATPSTAAPTARIWSGRVPQQGPRPDHILNPDYDPKSVDVPGAVLLGERQLTFLDDWGRDWRGADMKAALSQTIFCGGAHIHGRVGGRLHADLDSNGWPQTGRNKAIAALRKATGQLGTGGPVKALVTVLRRKQELLSVVELGRQDNDAPPALARKAWLPVQTQVLTRRLAEALEIKARGGVRVTRVLPCRRGST